MNITQLLNTKAGKKLANDYQAEQDQERTDLFTELDTIKEQRNNELPALSRALDKATAACVEASAKLEAAKISERTANSKLQQAKCVYSSNVVRIQKELTATAPESIGIFCNELAEESRKLRNAGITKHGKTSNARSMTLRIEAMREAVIEAESFKLLPATDIDSRLQALRAGLPAIVMQ